MKKLIIFGIACLSIKSGNLMAQTRDTLAKFDANIFSGYRSTLGYFGLKMGYTPELAKNRLNINAGLGVSSLQGRISIGTNFALTRSYLISPYIASDYIIGLPSHVLTNNGSEGYKIGLNNYISPSVGLKIGRLLWLRVETGYSFLINTPKIDSEFGADTQYNNFLKRLDSGMFVNIGLGGEIDFSRFRRK